MIDRVIDIIIRPPRTVYDVSLIPKEFKLDSGEIIKREPVKLQNSRGQTLHASYFPALSFAPGDPCVIFLHGNASSQVEGMFLPPILCVNGISVFTFDMSGSGCADGNYISLGYNEREDVKAACSYVRDNFKVNNIVLWGRSMGAATAAWCAAIPELRLSGIICDSPYVSVDAIIEDVINESWFFWTLAKVFLPWADKKIKEKIGTSVHDINLLKDVERAKVPALFVHTIGDSFIKVRQSRELFARYGATRKYLYTPNGDHGSPRQNYVIAQELNFAFEVFDLEVQLQNVDNIDDNSSNHFLNPIAMCSKMHLA